ncbi:hypothetical protein FSARC_14390 [Fusarium sarcochroum]|uniref:Knr4/Smi1-like domain-containing protein n=1 Tax=Fusarium sarcochroum TaxID=1208366 RepID=A0A8H4SU08_9HYPO|nr:hypothetical protein FSARC_14390 [Fusarium sarcochroum]
MASLSYTDQADPGENGYFVQHTISDLVSSLLEPADTADGLRRITRFVELLLLSNHIDKAYALIRVLYQNHDAILSQSSSNAEAALHMTGRPFGNFWEAHPTYPNPGKASDKFGGPDATTAQREKLAMQQWHEYRECTRTGWMLEHCSLPEPEDPHTWRETDDAPMIAMCARLLAKNKTSGHYASQENTREALDAAKKLYAQPQVPVTEWKFKWNGKQTMRRHSYLLYRRLVVELAIRVGELETAAEILSLGLKLDGFNDVDGGQLDRYLFLPGIYDVLPLLAKRKKEGNPFYINADDADAMIHEVTVALELRAREGRQWSLAPEKVGWKELLDRLARGAWVVNRQGYEELGLTCAEDILRSPATEEEIAEAEAKVGELPPDFKEMVRVANGFQGGWHFLNGGINGLEDIDIADPDDIEDYMFSLGDPDENIWSKVIVLSTATECDGFMHFMISPANWRNPDSGENFKDGEYPYWNWASWQGGYDIRHSFRDWVASEVESIEGMMKKGIIMEDEK